MNLETAPSKVSGKHVPVEQLRRVFILFVLMPCDVGIAMRKIDVRLLRQMKGQVRIRNGRHLGDICMIHRKMPSNTRSVLNALEMAWLYTDTNGVNCCVRRGHCELPAYWQASRSGARGA